MKKLGELMMILDLHRQGVKIAVIARQVGVDRKTVRKYIARGVELPTYGLRQPRERLLDPYIDYLPARRVMRSTSETILSMLQIGVRDLATVLSLLNQVSSGSIMELSPPIESGFLSVRASRMRWAMNQAVL